MPESSGRVPPPAAAAAARRAPDPDDYPDDIFGPPGAAAGRAGASAYMASPVSGSALPTDDPLGTWARTTRFAVLSHFSQITSAARSGAHALLSHPIAARIAAESAGAGPRAAGLADAITSFAQHGPLYPLGPSDPEWRHSEAAKAIGGEFDSARVFLARFARQVAEQAERSRLAEQDEARKKGEQGGVAHEPSVLGAFEILDLQPSVQRPTPTRDAARPITSAEWESFFDKQGAPVVPFCQARQLIFRRSLGPAPTCKPGADAASLQVQPRCQAWSFLLGAEEWHMGETAAERARKWERRIEEYWVAKRAWAGPSAMPLSGVAPAPRSAHDPLDAATPAQERTREEQRCAELRQTPWMKEQAHRVHVDCVRTDRKLPLFANLPTPPAPAKASSSTTSPLTGPQPDVDTPPPPNPHMAALADVLMTYVIWDQAHGEGSGAVPGSSSQPDGVEESVKALGEKIDLASGRTKHTALGSYVQGMSDLCATIYSVCAGDEARTFWCFAGFMERVRSNFYADQSGMRRQLSLLQKLIQVMDPAVYAHLESTDSLHLFFCFRWLLVVFKREFDFSSVIKLWEATWAAELRTDDDDAERRDGTSGERQRAGLTDHLHLFVVLAILQQHRDPLLTYLYNFDEILLYFQGLSHTIDVEQTLAQAEVLARTLAALIEQRDAADAAAAGSKPGGKTIDAPAAAALPVIDDDLRALVQVPHSHL